MGAWFLPNPEKYWGPNIRAGRQITSKHGKSPVPQTVVCHEVENDASQSIIKQEINAHITRKGDMIITRAANSYTNTM